MTGVKATEEQREKIRRLKSENRSTDYISAVTGLAKSTICQFLRNEKYCPQRNDQHARTIINVDKIEQFRKSVFVGDRFRIYRNVINDDFKMETKYVTVTVKAVYPYVVDCDIGSYQYIDLMQGERL